MLMRIAHYETNSRQRSNFLWRSLRVATGDDDLRLRILPAHASNRGARILVGGRRHRTRIDDYDGSLLRRISPSQAALFELAFESRAIRLRGATAEIFYVITGHILMLTQ